MLGTLVKTMLVNSDLVSPWVPSTLVKTMLVNSDLVSPWVLGILVKTMLVNCGFSFSMLAMGAWYLGQNHVSKLWF